MRETANLFLHLPVCCYLTTYPAPPRAGTYPTAAFYPYRSPTAHNLGHEETKYPVSKLQNKVCSVYSLSYLCFLFMAQKSVIRHSVRIYCVHSHCVGCHGSEKDRGHHVCSQEPEAARELQHHSLQRGRQGVRCVQLRAGEEVSVLLKLSHCLFVALDLPLNCESFSFLSKALFVLFLKPVAKNHSNITAE